MLSEEEALKQPVVTTDNLPAEIKFVAGVDVEYDKDSGSHRFTGLQHIGCHRDCYALHAGTIPAGLALPATTDNILEMS